MQPRVPTASTASPASPALASQDVVSLLTAQHRTLEGLLQALVINHDGAERAVLLSRVGDELAVHLGAEEAIVYPAVHAGRTEDILLESLEEHLSLKRLLADLLALPTLDDTFTPKCKVLDEQARHHHRHEEEELFPRMRGMLQPEALRELARQVREHEQALRNRGRPRENVRHQTDAAEPLP